MKNGTPARKTPKTRICFFRTTDENWDRLEAVQQRTGATPSEQLRRALESWLRKQEAGR